MTSGNCAFCGKLLSGEKIDWTLVDIIVHPDCSKYFPLFERDEPEIILDALLVLWEEHHIGDKEMTDKLRAIATKLRDIYKIPKRKFQEF